ncbi:MAG: FtsX-like permease family protein [Leptonema illini]|uniref:FtsX-like permease family protein n=1 Tax=Leptonema illini TaxID=183 RepID=A0A833H2Y4_9LEPT|nr:MAG: FtsX-like permease family protein [Leptonema illini]
MIWNSFSLALISIGRNLLRSTLTMLGVIIGVAAVVTMVNLGRGATESVKAQISSMGSNLLFVRPGQMRGPGARVNADPFELSDARAIVHEVPSVLAAAPTTAKGMVVVYGARNWTTSVTGTTNDYFKIRDMSVTGGRIFSEAEQDGGKLSCVIGETVRRELFGSADPIGERIRLGTLACDVVGLLAPKGQTTMGSDADDTVIIPIRAFFRRIAGSSDVSSIQVQAKVGVPTSRVKSDLEAMLRDRRRIRPGQDDNFSVMDMQEIVQVMTGTTQVLTSLLGAVAAVSLLVGGIGIMNIMLVSVTERTREIGIRQAIGAFESDVLLQFLVEAAVLSSLGGLIGLVLALIACIGISALIDLPFLFDPLLALGAFLFSAAVGIIFGYLPARKAAKLDPIEALRRE